MPNVYIPTSHCDAAAVNPNDIKMLLANSLSAFFNKGKPVFSSGSNILSRNPPVSTISDYWVFNNFILADELLALRSPETYLSINNNLYGNMVSPFDSPITFDERFKVTSVPYLIPDFNLSSSD